MKKVLVLVVLALVVASIPASAAYKYNWTSGFEPSRYHAGELAPMPVNTPGQDGWFIPDNPSYPSGTVRPNEVPMDVVPGAGIGGSYGAVVRDNAGPSAAAKDMRVLNSGGKNYYKGYAKFWVYDPGVNTVDGRVDARAGIYSDKGPTNIGYMATAQIQDAVGRDTNYWYAQWSYSVAKLDGSAVAGAAGYSFTAGAAAPRVYQAWSYVLMNWSFNYVTGGTSTAVIQWRINQSTVSPNLTLNLDSTAARWASFNQIVGIYIGAGATTSPNTRTGPVFDNLEFHGDPVPPVPEPSSLLALGTGAIGLLGLIRRRK